MAGIQVVGRIGREASRAAYIPVVKKAAILVRKTLVVRLVAGVATLEGAKTVAGCQVAGVATLEGAKTVVGSQGVVTILAGVKIAAGSLGMEATLVRAKMVVGSRGRVLPLATAKLAARGLGVVVSLVVLAWDEMDAMLGKQNPKQMPLAALGSAALAMLVSLALPASANWMTFHALIPLFRGTPLPTQDSALDGEVWQM